MGGEVSMVDVKMPWNFTFPYTEALFDSNIQCRAVKRKSRSREGSHAK
jgi:hypothetical protein